MKKSKDKNISELKKRIKFFHNEFYRLRTESVLENNPSTKYGIEQNMKEALMQKENAEKLLDYILKNSDKIDLSDIKIKQKDNIMATSNLSIDGIWDQIEKDFDISKRAFGKKFNFVTDQFKRKIIFRDTEHAYILANHGFSKPSVILAGSVIEELLRLYLDYKGIKPANKTFDSYIKACENNELLKSAISRLTDSVRHFRNIVHLQKENNSKITISKATAKGAVTSIFTLANDF
jgi:hypothetical protein